MSRRITHRYTDPLDLIWLACARDCGLTIARSDTVYASFDGEHTLTLSTPEHFDADDSLAQLIFHELCHALVAGPKASHPDWGMENIDERDLIQEHACHRLQAALADAYGLRTFFAVTTHWRPYWDALPVEPLTVGADPAIALAREAHERLREGPWLAPITKALTQTQQIAAIVRSVEPKPEELWTLTRPMHASGFPLANDDGQTCGDCAWSFEASGLRCRHTRNLPKQRGTRVAADAVACVRFEPKLDEEECGRCGACCREAFDRVEVRATDLIKKRHPGLVVVDGFGEHLPRPGGRCVALEGDGENAPYLCRVYADRPKSCADFAIAGDACLEARRRVGRRT